jgi:hypothetical protein
MMPICLIPFIIPQVIFVVWEIREKIKWATYCLDEKNRREQQLRDELADQRKKEEMGKWK